MGNCSSSINVTFVVNLVYKSCSCYYNVDKKVLSLSKLEKNGLFLMINTCHSKKGLHQSWYLSLEKNV